jgi:hypothetical protein
MTKTHSQHWVLLLMVLMVLCSRLCNPGFARSDHEAAGPTENLTVATKTLHVN